MTHWAKPGVQCVCIKDEFGGWGVENGPQIPVRCPMLNEVLTVKRVRLEDGIIYLTFDEIDEYQVATDGKVTVYGTILYDADYFRPLIKRKTDISIFKAMLTPAGKVKVDA